MKNIFKTMLVPCVLMLGNCLAPTAEVSGVAGPLASVTIPNNANERDAYGLLRTALPGYKFVQGSKIVDEETFRIPVGTESFPVYAVRTHSPTEIVGRFQGLALRNRNELRNLYHFQHIQDCYLLIPDLPAFGNEQLDEHNLDRLLACRLVRLVKVKPNIADRFNPIRLTMLEIYLSNIPQENRGDSIVKMMDLYISTNRASSISSTNFPNTQTNIGLLDMAFRYWVNANPDITLDGNTLKMGRLDIKCSIDPLVQGAIKCDLRISSGGDQLMNIAVPADRLIDILNIIKNGRHFIL